jgi:hypothetical protein
LIANSASAVRPGISAVQRMATPYTSSSLRFSAATSPTSRWSEPTSEISGPCRVSRTVIRSSVSRPATLNTSTRLSSGSIVSPYRATLPRIFSR